MTEGGYGWAAVAAAVVASDAAAVRRRGETMSSCFWRRRRLGIPIAAYVVAHLLHAIPARWDPLRRLNPLGDR